jgi:hypothetical protein
MVASSVLLCVLCGASLTAAFMPAGSAASALQITTKSATLTRASMKHRSARQAVAMQAMTEEETAADQALIARVAAEVQRDSGVDLDQLINPSKVINLERELVKLRAELSAASSSTSAELQSTIEKKELKLSQEKRAIMQDWLKQIFVGQAVLSAVIAGFMVYDAVPGFEHVDLSIRVLGFWVIWLFAVPSLRARKPTNPAEKSALNIAFIATPLTSLAMPFITKVSNTAHTPVSLYQYHQAYIVSAVYSHVHVCVITLVH